MNSDTTVSEQAGILRVAAFRGMQPTGIAICGDGRKFVCFPRWRECVPYSVAELLPDGRLRPYPDPEANDWELGRPLVPNRFVCVQSVAARKGKLYVLDTKNPSMKELIDVPTIYAYDLGTDRLEKRYRLESAKIPSYINDLRVDDAKGKIYLTDSGVGGILVVDIATGENFRVLDNHPFTTAESDHLVADGRRYEAVVHSDGIALDRVNGILYFHALTGYTLYGIPTAQLIEGRVDERNAFCMRTPACDGMIMDERGTLYMGDLERNAIVCLRPGEPEIRTLAQGGDIRWPDTFALHGGELYFTNSRIPEAQGDISQMEFTVDKIRLPQ